MEGLTTYQSFNNSIEQFEKNEHYLNLMCLKDTRGLQDIGDVEHYLENVIRLEGRENLKKKCVLPKGHSGTCSYHFNFIFKESEENKIIITEQTNKNKEIKKQNKENKENKQKTIPLLKTITSKLKSSINTAIFLTPGNDDYVYKNRAQRIYPYVLESKEEKKIRDKQGETKKKCAIPLKDATSPILMAQAYLDWMTFIVNVKDINKHFDSNGKNYKVIMNMLSLNKDNLMKVYSNRQIFDENGHSICVISKEIININDISDADRDNRTDPIDSDIQLGHNHPRSELYVSIRGGNLLPMSRRGNCIIGERIFTEDKWIHELKKIAASF
jgi:hypothetical protein